MSHAFFAGTIEKTKGNFINVKIFSHTLYAPNRTQMFRYMLQKKYAVWNRMTRDALDRVDK
jgi:hypothetical protein